MKKIETKIAKNGTKMYYVEGKRVNREVAIQTAADNRGGAFIIKREKKNYVYSVVSYVESGEYTSTDTYEFNKIYFKTTYNGTELWVNPDTEKFGAMVFGSYNKDNVKKVAADIEAAFINGAKGVTIKENATVEVITGEANPDDYAVSQEAMDVAVDAETELANKVSKTAKKNYSINPVIGEDDNMKLNHVDIYTKGNKVEISGCFESKRIETAYRRFRKIMIQIDADHPELQLGGENDWLPANKITLVSTGEKYEEHFCGYNENDDMIFSASPVEALAVDINEDWFYFYGKFTIENIKEETQMTNTIEVANEGNATITIGDDTVTFVNGKFHSVFSAKYHMAIIRDLVGCYSYCIFGDDDTEVYNVREHETSYDNFMETLYQRGNREKLLALRKDYIITDHLSENNSHMWYVNGKRSGQVKVYNLLQSYGLTIAEFLAEDEAYINERIAASAAKIAIEDQAKFLKDKIARDAQPCDDNDDVFNLIPNVDIFDDEQPTTRNKYWQARAWFNRTISKGKEYWFLFGRRVKKDSVDVAALLYDYGLTPDKFAAEDQKVIDEEQRELAIRWATWQKEWFAEYLADKIKRDSKSYDDNGAWNLIPNVDGNDNDDTDDELIDPPVDKEPYRPFTVEDTIESLNHSINWAKDTLATMTGDTYTDNIGETFTRNQLEQLVIDWQDEIADLQPQADKTAEPPKPVELVAPTVMSALETINAMFPLDGFVEDVSKPNFRSAVNGDWRLNIFIDKNGTPEAVSLAEDDQLFLTVKIKARSLRDSINRAIKTCVKNRIAYRKNHNAEMEKYEYELMHLLQAARRELEVA